MKKKRNLYTLRIRKHLKTLTRLNTRVGNKSQASLIEPLKFRLIKALANLLASTETLVNSSVNSTLICRSNAKT